MVALARAAPSLARLRERWKNKGLLIPIPGHDWLRLRDCILLAQSIQREKSNWAGANNTRNVLKRLKRMIELDEHLRGASFACTMIEARRMRDACLIAHAFHYRVDQHEGMQAAHRLYRALAKAISPRASGHLPTVRAEPQQEAPAAIPEPREPTKSQKLVFRGLTKKIHCIPGGRPKS